MCTYSASFLVTYSAYFLLQTLNYYMGCQKSMTAMAMGAAPHRKFQCSQNEKKQ